MALNKAGVFKEAIEPLFHTTKATVVAEDTFIAPLLPRTFAIAAKVERGALHRV